MKLFLTLIHIDVDQAGYTEKLWQYFIVGAYSQKLAALITTRITLSKESSLPLAQKTIKFWLTLFLQLPYWYRYVLFVTKLIFSLSWFTACSTK